MIFSNFISELKKRHVIQAQTNLQYRKALDLYSQFLIQRPNSNVDNQRFILIAVTIGEDELASKYLSH